MPFLTYTDVTAEHLTALQGMKLKTSGASDKSAQKAYLGQVCMKIDCDEGSFPYEIAADFHLHNYQFCLGT